MKKISKWFLILVMCLAVCAPAWAADGTYFYTHMESGSIYEYYVTFAPGARYGFYYTSEDTVSRIYSDMPFTYQCGSNGDISSTSYSSVIKIGAGGTNRLYVGNIAFVPDHSLGTNAVELPVSDLGGAIDYLVENDFPNSGPGGSGSEYSGERITDSITNYYTHHYLSGHTSGTAVIESGAPYLFVQQSHKNTLYEWFISDSLFSVSGDFLIENGEPFLTEGYYMRGQTLSAGLDFSRLDSRVVVIPADFKGTPIDYVKQYGFPTGGSGGESPDGYSPLVPAPANVRYVKTGTDTAGLVWDNNDSDDKYHVVIRGVFHWKNNNPVGSWVQDNVPFTGDSSGDVTVQLLDSSDLYKVSKSGYSIPADKFEEIKQAVTKEAKKHAVWWTWYPSEFQVQYFGYDENGKKIYGDAAICKINWSNVKKGEWTSSTMIYSGGVRDDTGADGEQSTTHVTDWGEVMGGGGASWDDSNEYDSSGNIVKSDSAENTLQDFINGLVNIPDILNRFFQTIQLLMSGISQLPALFSTIVAYMPPEFTSLFGMGLVIVIILRIFGR